MSPMPGEPLAFAHFPGLGCRALITVLTSLGLFTLLFSILNSK